MNSCLDRSLVTYRDILWAVASNLVPSWRTLVYTGTVRPESQVAQARAQTPLSCLAATKMTRTSVTKSSTPGTEEGTPRPNDRSTINPSLYGTVRSPIAVCRVFRFGSFGARATTPHTPPPPGTATTGCTWWTTTGKRGGDRAFSSGATD